MTRRERLESKLEKRRTWSESAEKRAAERFDSASGAIEGIPLGQPILVGHHSEKKHRGALAKHDSNMTKGVEELNKAKHHDEKAEGIESQLDNSIFSDDEDAEEAIKARIAELEAEADLGNRINKAWRKGRGAENWADGLGLSEKTQATCEKTMKLCPYLGVPCFTKNTRANARRMKKRLVTVQWRKQRDEKCKLAGGLLIKHFENGYTIVRFSDKPDYSIIRNLKDADYSWGHGEWRGKTENFPESINELKDDATNT